MLHNYKYTGNKLKYMLAILPSICSECRVDSYESI